MDKTNKTDNIFNSLSNSSSGKIDPKAIKQAAASGNAEPLLKNLSNSDKQKINAVLSDKQALEALLKSPEAAAILRFLKGGGNNG